MLKNIQHILKDNAERNARKNEPYNPISGEGADGERFELFVMDKQPQIFHLPMEMKKLKSVKLLQKYKSIKKTLEKEVGEKPTQYDIDLFWLKLCEERYKYDFEFFAIACITIEDKQTAELIPFKLNPAQRMLLKTMEKMRKQRIQITVQVLKAKQMGFSTLIQMYMKWVQVIHKRNWNSVVCAHVRDAAINVRSMYERSITQMQPIRAEKINIQSFGQTQNIKQIPERGCRLTIGFATEPESVRSQNVKMVHFSEEAFYPHTDNNNPELLEASIISSSTKGEFTMIIRESTANGVGDYFHKQWERAKKGETAFVPIFAPWYMIDIYSEPFNEDYYTHAGRKKKGTIEDFINSFNEYEWNIWKNHTDCTLENINWRRMMAAVMPNESKMKQEYPIDDIEAFQDSGSPVFRSEDIEALRPDCTPPSFLGKLVSKCEPELSITEPHRQHEILHEIRFVADNNALELLKTGDAKQKVKAGEAKLQIWVKPDELENISNRYIVVFDPQKGKTESADWGVIKVIDRYWMMHGEEPEIVAMWYGHIDKDITLWIAAQIARYYNDALLVVESNTYDSDEKEDDSEFIFEKLKRHYDNLYSRTSPDKVDEGRPLRFGFHTNRNTKPAVISTYQAILREKGYIERDEETLNEARIFENKKDGSTGAKAGGHDDRLMATMIGLYICYQLPTPKKIVKKTHTTTKRRIAY